MLWEWRGIANMDFIQLGGNSRVDEMILARVSSGFAGKKYGRTPKLTELLEGSSKRVCTDMEQEVTKKQKYKVNAAEGVNAANEEVSTAELVSTAYVILGSTDNSSETKLRGRLLESFQEDAKYEHVGQDTRSQGGKDDQDKQGKDLEISKSKTKSKDNDKTKCLCPFTNIL
ncbi:hypothetical protein Tco_1237383 [Tanacetum coccineum]